MNARLSLAFAAVVFGSSLGSSYAANDEVRHRVHDRPLTITRPAHNGVFTQGNDTIAIGGFSANGYGYRAATAEERKAAYNAKLRNDATGLYGYGVDGLGGTFEDGREGGYNNPYWGNSFNRYVGFNGTPTILAFGPGFANRYAADHDPIDDDDTPPPSPRELGFEPRPK